ncbi:MAG: DUF3570 domain-containing protein [Pseudomonadota bacterium]
MKSHTLLALTASAMALPGIASLAKADAAPTESTLSYRASTYQEDDLPAIHRLAGSVERYDIDVHQLRLLMPVGETYSLTVNSSYESMSGASPWYAVRRIDGSPGIVMSGATISEQRRDLNVSGRKYLTNGAVGINLAVSHENDYDSISGGFDGERHFNDNLTTLAAGLSYSSDEIDPSDPELFNRVTDETKHSESVFMSVSQILNQTSVIQTGLNITHLSGYLSDPYKLNDKRPDSRTQTSWTTSWRKYITRADAALHADYRYFHDSFGINSHTIDLNWYQNIGANFQLIPGVRYYSQTEADFFTPTLNFTGTLPFQSTDYRLSAYGAVSGSLKLQWQIHDFTLSLAAERYHSNADYAFSDGPQSPALVSFNRYSFGLDFQF